MFMQPKFEVLLRELEGPTASKRQLDHLYKYLKNDNVYNPIFESYVSRRIHENIHPEKLLNLAYHMEKSEKTKYLSRSVNRQVVSHMLLKDEGIDQFIFMNRHDVRSDNHIMDSLINHFTGYSNSSNWIELINKLTPTIGIDKYTLILKLLESGEFRSFRNLVLIERLPIEDQLLLMVRALEKDSIWFAKILDWTKTDARNLLDMSITKDGDNDKFATALRNCTIPVEQLEACYTLTEFIDAHINDIPGTIARLYYRAEQEERWEYLLVLGSNKNKKELLRSIVKSKDQELIDKFFGLYKNSPEVKHLVPFM